MAEYWDRERGRRYRGEGYYGGYYGYPERERDREREYERRGGDRGFFDRAGDGFVGGRSESSGTPGYEPGGWTGQERYGRSPSMGRSAAMGGPYAGRGPRGYQRSDERIREDVCERMSDCGELDATDIEVRV